MSVQSPLRGPLVNRSCTTTLLVIVALAAASGAQTAEKKPAVANAEPAQALLGDWHGTSLCLVKPSACHDEEALYHVKALPKQSGKFSVQADKVVNGKPVVMGTTDCSYDAPKRLLHCEWGRGFLDLTLQGGHLDGSMFLPDKTRWREIKLTKVRP